jgi:hypothetical protein
MKIETLINNLRKVEYLRIDEDGKVLYCWQQDIRLFKPATKVFIGGLIDHFGYQLKTYDIILIDMAELYAGALHSLIDDNCDPDLIDTVFIEFSNIRERIPEKTLDKYEHIRARFEYAYERHLDFMINS